MVRKLEVNAKVSSIATQMISAEAGYELLFSASQLLGGLCSDAKKVSEASLLASFKAVASLPTTAAPPTGKYSRVSCFFSGC